MIIVDNALKAREREGRPIRVGMVGAGFMGQGLTNQITNSVPGMRMAAIYNRKPERADGVYRYSGLEDVVRVDTQAALDDAIRRGPARSWPRTRSASAARPRSTSSSTSPARSSSAPTSSSRRSRTASPWC